MLPSSPKNSFESIVLDTGHTIDGTRLRSIGTYAAIVWPDSDSETKDHRP